MNWRNESKFQISGLNQEKLLNQLCKTVSLSEIERKSKSSTTFKCSYLDYKKVEKTLKENNIVVEEISHDGWLYNLKKVLTSYGMIFALLVFSVFYFFQSQFVLQYDVQGVDKLGAFQVVEFVKTNFSNKISQLDTKEVEVKLVDKFEEISFASCMIKGQTLVINIKEKLLPEEMYGNFSPLVADKDAKITKIDLISGTLCVKVGDIVRKGDVLVEPYTIDTAGQIKKVEAKATILAEVYNEGSAQHFETKIEVNRTGRVAVQNVVSLFGLAIYSFKEEYDFKMYEVEHEDVNMAKNLFLPFKLKKTYIYELKEEVVKSTFEDVQEKYIEKAKEKALQICEGCDKIKDEFYTIRHMSGVTIVNYCVVSEEQICVKK